MLELSRGPWRTPGPRTEPYFLGRTTRGLAATALLDDLHVGGPYTLLAPVDAAFDALPWSFEELLHDPRLVEPRFDLFEYLVVRGLVGARDDGAPRTTLHGDTVCIREGLVLGRSGVARVLLSRPLARGVVHVIDRVLMPIEPAAYELDEPEDEIRAARG